MNEKLDKKTQALLLEALERAKADGKKMQEKRENSLWRTVNLPCSLYDALIGLTKYQMDTIRKNYEFKNLSSLKKAELATELSRLIPLKFKEIIYRLDQGRYDLIKAVIKSSGFVSDLDISFTSIESLMEYSLIFPGKLDDKSVLFMPNELIRVFSQIDGGELEAIVRRNTQWIQLTHGLVYYYGVIDMWLAKKKIAQISGVDFDFLDYVNVMDFASDFYGQVDLTGYGFRDPRIFEPKKIINEHRMRPDVDYYSFTKNQLIKASRPDYYDRTPEMNNFINFLSRNYKLSNQELDEIAFQVTSMINIDSKPTFILEYLQSMLEFPSFEFLQTLTSKTMELYNNTRQWALKGHTPNELHREERKNLIPLPTKPFNVSKQNTNNNDKQPRIKVGRNKPCPCGSGKKYKKCCGR